MSFVVAARSMSWPGLTLTLSLSLSVSLSVCMAAVEAPAE